MWCRPSGGTTSCAPWSMPSEGTPGAERAGRSGRRGARSRGRDEAEPDRARPEPPTWYRARWIPVLAAALLLLAYTLARPGPALVGAGRPAARCRPAAGPAPDRGEPRAGGRAIPARAAAEFLKEAGPGHRPRHRLLQRGDGRARRGPARRRARGAGAGRQVARPRHPLSRAVQPRVVGLLAAEADTSRAEEFLDEAADRLAKALMLEPSSARAKWNLELATRRKPPPPPAGGGGGGGAAVRRWRRAKPAAARRIEEPGADPEPGGADPQLDGPAGAGDEGGAAAAAADRLGRRGEGLVIALLLAALVSRPSRPRSMPAWTRTG